MNGFVKWLRLLTVCIACSLNLSASAFWGRPAQSAPDYYMVTTTASWRPVDIPGTQRRVAQNDAELRARKQILEYVGSMPVRGRGTINDVMARDARLKAKVLEMVRTAEVADWVVNPACACVQVWVRIDLNQIRGLLTVCGY